MSWMMERLQISKWLIFTIICFISVVASGLGAYLADKSTFYAGLFSGICSGVLLLLIDKWIDRSEIKFLSSRDHIIETIEGRENAEYYARFIKESKEEINFLGRTGYRLLSDFADTDSRSPSKRLLLEALSRGVTVKFLIADEEYLQDQAVDDVARMESLSKKVKEAYPNASFSVRRYFFHPSFSYFRADDIVIFGANFPTQKSRHTPSVVARIKSSVASSYARFFDETWKSLDERD